MTAICGKHCHNLGQLEQSFYAGGKAATIYDHFESHQEWDTPNGACYCKECTTKALKPTGQQVELTKKSDSKPKFLEEKEKMMIHCASTDISITDVRENTCTTNPSLRLIAIIYAYIDELTGNEGMDALQIGQAVKKWEGLWYSQIDHWKDHHEAITRELIGGSPEQTEARLEKTVEEAAQQEQDRDAAKKFVKATQEMLRAIRQAVPYTTDYNLYILCTMTLPEAMLEFPPKINKAKWKHGREFLRRAEKWSRSWLTEREATKNIVLRELRVKPSIQSMEIGRVQSTHKRDYYMVHLKLLKNVTLKVIEEQLHYYTQRWMPAETVLRVEKEGKLFIPEFTYIKPTKARNGSQWRETTDKDMIRMCEIGKEMMLILEEEDVEEQQVEDCVESFCSHQRFANCNSNCMAWISMILEEVGEYAGHVLHALVQCFVRSH